MRGAGDRRGVTPAGRVPDPAAKPALRAARKAPDRRPWPVDGIVAGGRSGGRCARLSRKQCSR